MKTALASLLPLLASAVPTLDRRADSCGQYDSTKLSTYTVYDNQWGKDSATSGSQCYGTDGSSGSTIKWHTTWTWQGGQYNVKSYPNAVVDFKSTPLSSIKSMKSSWSWDYTGSDLVADVAYDLFTSSSPTGSNQYEVMIWLAALGGAGPISSTYGADGKPVPIASVSLGGNNFKLYKGPNGSMTVFSFIADNQITRFSGDLKQFTDYLTSKQGLPSSQYLLSAGAGTETFTGSNAKFTVNGYSLVIGK